MFFPTKYGVIIPYFDMFHNSMDYCINSQEGINFCFIWGWNNVATFHKVENGDDLSLFNSNPNLYFGRIMLQNV